VNTVEACILYYPGLNVFYAQTILNVKMIELEIWDEICKYARERKTHNGNRQYFTLWL